MTWLLLYSDELSHANRSSSGPQNVHEESYPGADAFRAEIEHFIECSKTGAKPRASGEAGKKAVAICRAVKKSAEIGGPVDIKW